MRSRPPSLCFTNLNQFWMAVCMSRSVAVNVNEFLRTAPVKILSFTLLVALLKIITPIDLKVFFRFRLGTF